MPVLPGQASANAEERREDEMQRGPTTKLSDAGPEESAGLRGPDSIMACLDHLGDPKPCLSSTGWGRMPPWPRTIPRPPAKGASSWFTPYPSLGSYRDVLQPPPSDPGTGTGKREGTVTAQLQPVVNGHLVAKSLTFCQVLKKGRCLQKHQLSTLPPATVTDALPRRPQLPLQLCAPLWPVPC